MKTYYEKLLQYLTTFFIVLLVSCGGGGGSTGSALSISNLSPTSVTLSTTPAGTDIVNFSFNESGGTGNITGYLDILDNSGNLLNKLTTPNTTSPAPTKSIIFHVATSLLTAGTSGTFNVYESDSAGSVTNKLTGAWNVVASSGPTLNSISVTPANPSINVGVTQQFAAKGTYSDSSTRDLTTTVTWNSSKTVTAIISSSGLATAQAAGSTTIQATSGSILGSTILTVTSAPPPPQQYGSILWKNTSTTGYLDYLSISSDGGVTWYPNQLPSAYSPLNPNANFTLTNVPPGTYVAEAKDTESWSHTVVYGMHSTPYTINTTYCSATPSFTVSAGGTSTVTFAQTGFTGSLLITNTDPNNYMTLVYVDSVLINPFNIYPGGYVQTMQCTMATGTHTVQVYWSNGTVTTAHPIVNNLTTTIL